MVNIAIIGCGSIVNWRHAPECRDDENINLKGFYNINIDKAEKNAATFGGKVYKEFEDVLADETVDAVIISTPNKFHCDMTVRALESGKHVLCEKPMALSVEECKKMVEASERTGKFLMIAQSQRTDAVSRKAKELLDEGKLGKVLSFRASFANGGPDNWCIDGMNNNWFFDKNRAGFGSLGDLGVHKIDLVRWLIGEDFKYVTAKVGTRAKKDSEGNMIKNDDTAYCILETESGVFGVVEAGWAHFGSYQNEALLFCEKGTMEIYTDSPSPMIKISMPGGIKETYDITQGNSYMAKTFAECIINNKKPDIDGMEGLKAINVVEKAEESSNKGVRLAL